MRAGLPPRTTVHFLRVVRLSRAESLRASSIDLRVQRAMGPAGELLVQLVQPKLAATAAHGCAPCRKVDKAPASAGVHAAQVAQRRDGGGATAAAAHCANSLVQEVA